ncbi:MAG: MOSC domain-containing protein [Acidobacteriota bacterium]
MSVLSLNVGRPRVVHAGGREVTTGIFKAPVDGPVMLRRFNLEGDQQADLTVHGGRFKALYAYPSEHYAFWRSQLPTADLPWSMFGENLTTEGLREDDACLGDRFQIGEAVVAVTQPRMPCYKLGIRFGRPDIVKRFLASGRSGVYFEVVEEGRITRGDPIQCVHRDPNRISIADVNRAYRDPDADIPLVRRLVDLEILPPGVHGHFVETLGR